MTTDTSPARHRWAVDPTIAAAVLAVYVTYNSITRAIASSATPSVLLDAAAVVVMVAVTAWHCPPPSPWNAPVVPTPVASRVPDRRAQIAVAIIVTLVAAVIARIAVEDLAHAVWPTTDALNYNDPAITGHNVTVALIDSVSAGVGEELVYRAAFLAVLARYMPTSVAVVAQAVVFGLSHTGFDRGYDAATVCGLIAFAVVFGAAVVMTRSIWPAVIVHSLSNVIVVLADYYPDSIWLGPVVVIAAMGVFVLATNNVAGDRTPSTP